MNIFEIYTYNFFQKSDKASPHQSRYPDLIGQFYTDILLLARDQNVVTDALCRIESVESRLDYAALAVDHENDGELKALLARKTSWHFEKVVIPGTNIAVTYDVFTKTIRPYITLPFRRAAFRRSGSYSQISSTALFMAFYPGRLSAIRLRMLFVTSLKSFGKSPDDFFAKPLTRFEHVHIDIIKMPISKGNRYCVTCVDRYTLWPEAYPIPNMQSETVARAFHEEWICHTIENRYRPK